jgi:antirestriction protein ArdC
MKKNKKLLHDEITDIFIKSLKEDNIPWIKPWSGGTDLAQNGISRKPYNGLNELILNCAPYSSPYYFTFNQAKSLSFKIKKGEKSWPITYWKFFKSKDENGKEKTIPMLKAFRVFNLEQLDTSKNPKALEKYTISECEKVEFCPIEEAENLLLEIWPRCAKIEHSVQNRAYYSPSRDIISMPLKEIFNSSEEYYSTLFHEIIHSTGHQTRVNRKEVTDPNSFGSHDYSKEELVAEIGSCFLLNDCGITKTIENQKAYVKSWIKTLKNNPKYILEASSKAKKARAHLMEKFTDEKEIKEKVSKLDEDLKDRLLMEKLGIQLDEAGTDPMFFSDL